MDKQNSECDGGDDAIERLDGALQEVLDASPWRSAAHEALGDLRSLWWFVPAVVAAVVVGLLPFRFLAPLLTVWFLAQFIHAWLHLGFVSQVVHSIDCVNLRAVAVGGQRLARREFWISLALALAGISLVWSLGVA